MAGMETRAGMRGQWRVAVALVAVLLAAGLGGAVLRNLRLGHAAGPITPSPTDPTGSTADPTPTIEAAGRAGGGRHALATPSGPMTLAEAMMLATEYGSNSQVRLAIGVIDTKSGVYRGAGEDTALFASASVMKVLIVVQMLVTGQLTGPNAGLATAMIERSDDAAVEILWPLAGGPDVVNLVAARYHLKNLGTPNTRANFWGNTHLTARGLAELYRAVHADPVVWPWLSRAMAGTTPEAADGTKQFFGIPSATKAFAVKQGWGTESADDLTHAVVNSTGYVGSGRYAVVIFAEGSAEGSTPEGYNARLAGVVTEVARVVVPATLLGKL